eukprot:COSAG06_NODE_8728_length_2086_cov_2.567187_3_plen_53_part_00
MFFAMGGAVIGIGGLVVLAVGTAVASGHAWVVVVGLVALCCMACVIECAGSK